MYHYGIQKWSDTVGGELSVSPMRRGTALPTDSTLRHSSTLSQFPPCWQSAQDTGREQGDYHTILVYNRFCPPADPTSFLIPISQSWDSLHINSRVPDTPCSETCFPSVRLRG